MAARLSAGSIHASKGVWGAKGPTVTMGAPLSNAAGDLCGSLVCRLGCMSQLHNDAGLFFCSTIIIGKSWEAPEEDMWSAGVCMNLLASALF